MAGDRDFDAEHDEQPGDSDLVQDLDLTILWTAAGADETVRASLRAALLDPLTDPAQIDYRADVFADCLAGPDVVREMYALACRAIAEERELHRASYFSRSSEALLARSVNAMEVFVGALRELHALSGRSGAAFGSPAFVRFFAMVDAELDEDYLEQVAEHLRVLRFRDGVLASARLGRLNQGVDYVVRRPRPQNRSHLLPHHAPVSRPNYSRTVPRDDDGGLRDLAGLRGRILALAADALARSAEHVLAFFTTLRAELAFYIGCLELHACLTARGVPVCRAQPRAREGATLGAVGLYDPCLALRAHDRVQGNDLHADGVNLIVVTGANQGGKSTFLRSVGLAQLMMQAGMPVAAESFTAAVATDVHTHFAREEDASMTTGKFDEELARMSDVAARMRPGSLLLCNESFAATNEREAAEIADEVIGAFTGAGIRVLFVTHLYELAHRYFTEHRASTLFLRAERDEQGRRTHLLRPAPPRPTSFAADLFRRSFGEPFTDPAHRDATAIRPGPVGPGSAAPPP